MEGTIKNKAMVGIELCGRTVEVASDVIETVPVKLKITKSQDCEVVAIGERIKYTVHIENECGGELRHVKFKDEIDPCCEFLPDTFMVNGEHRHAEFREGVIEYEIEEIHRCEKMEITFEVIATERCCHGCHTQQTERPTIRTVLPLASAVSGTGISGAMVTVEFPCGEIRRTNVVMRNWMILAPERLHMGQIVTAWQKEENKKESEPVTRRVGL
ncbi:MAG: hypothetical protein FWE38_00060 [Firmicutes bacterium]|nr:hypothetical protein [Bacillota bacterium]